MAKKELWDIEYRDVVLFVTGYYEPEEKEITYDADMAGYPGAPAEFDIEAIECCDQDISELLSGDQTREIEIQILNEHYGHDY
jgi:hypothetical protein